MSRQVERVREGQRTMGRLFEGVGMLGSNCRTRVRERILLADVNLSHASNVPEIILP